jgi:type I restriction enzyme M protein
MARRAAKALATAQSVDQAVWAICDTMRRGNCAGALQYVPELTWILFVRILDEREQREQQEAEAVGVPFRPSLEAPYRWQDWAAPDGPKRLELQNGALGSFFATDVKVRKRSPLAAEHFAGFLRLLPERGQSQLSWFVDIEARRREAAEQARPLKEAAEAKTREAASAADHVRQLRKGSPPDAVAVTDTEARAKSLTKEARALLAKADEIEDAVYDLEAVNPNRSPVVDTRTPEQLLDTIEAKSREVAAALADLRQHG